MDELTRTKEKLRQVESQLETTRFLAQVMQDRLALIVAEAMGEEIEAILRGEGEVAREWEQVVGMLLHDDEGSRYRQAVIRGSDDYKPAKQRVRDWIGGILRTHKHRLAA